MKLSLSWIFDHIEADWKDQDIDLIAAKFNAIVAEIENVSRVRVDLSSFYLARQESTSHDGVTLSIPELSQTIVLPTRTGSNTLSDQSHPIFMVKKLEPDLFTWATLADFAGEKEGLLPAFSADEYAQSGAWRASFESDDIILEVDNKSLNHRPDMWGHRGFAREIAAFLNLPLLSDDEFLKKQPVIHAPKISSQTATTPIIIENNAPKACQRFVGLYVSSIENKPSSLKIATRLLRVGLRPLNALVDLSNYIACDWSQPVHVYDANKIEGSRVIIRMANPGEQLALLDGQTIELTESDLVIADERTPMCLAGVKGGSLSSVSATTKSIFFEAASFDAGTVRRASVRHKLRTDSSARFEKTLDSNQALDAVFRFLQLIQESGIEATVADEIIAVGIPDVTEQIIEVSHRFLESRIGVTLTEDDVIKPLTKLGFKVLESHTTNNAEPVYLIGVPTYRGSKDVKIKEDILEEVARCYGFEKIPHELPEFIRRPYDLSPMMRERKMKHFLVYGARMIEFQNYALSHEAFLASLGLSTEGSVALLNPVSENHSHLITSLIPGLLANIQENQMQQESLPIFEWGKIWPQHNGKAQEQYSLAGVFFERKNAVNFYACKAEILGLLKALGFDTTHACSWQKVKDVPAPWYNAYQTAQIMYGDHILGYAGMMDKTFLSKIDTLPESTAFVFELQGDLLRGLEHEKQQYTPFSRYQDSCFDVSLMVPITRTVQDFLHAFHQINSLIKKIELLDFFEKKDWADQRSLTFRFWLSDTEKTLEKTEIDAVWERVVASAHNLGAKLRAEDKS